MKVGIYKITERETGKCYIGKSKNINLRWAAHRANGYPIERFDYEVLVTCQVDELDELEVLMINTFDSHKNGFNKNIGRFPSEATKKKMSDAHQRRLNKTK